MICLFLSLSFHKGFRRMILIYLVLMIDRKIKEGILLWLIFLLIKIGGRDWLFCLSKMKCLGLIVKVSRPIYLGFKGDLLNMPLSLLKISWLQLLYLTRCLNQIVIFWKNWVEIGLLFEGSSEISSGTKTGLIKISTWNTYSWLTPLSCLTSTLLFLSQKNTFMSLWSNTQIYQKLVFSSSKITTTSRSVWLSQSGMSKITTLVSRGSSSNNMLYVRRSRIVTRQSSYWTIRWISCTSTASIGQRYMNTCTNTDEDKQVSS